jgi:hypothetical protein
MAVIAAAFFHPLREGLSYNDTSFLGEGNYQKKIEKNHNVTPKPVLIICYFGSSTFLSGTIAGGEGEREKRRKAKNH